MRAGVADAIRAGGPVRTLGPTALVSFLTAAAFTPLLVPVIGATGGGEVGAVLSQVGGIGGGYLAGVLTSVAERARREARGQSSPAAGTASIRAELAEQIERALEGGGEAGMGLRAEVAAVLRGVDAIGAALAADRDNVLSPGLAALGEQLTEFRWVLGALSTRLTEVQRTLLAQGVSQRSHILAARGELDTITGLLQHVLAAQEAATREPDGADGSARPGREACPYPGLRPFESRDARWFFGRQELTVHLIVRLAGQLDTGAPLFVLGPSGAGKSSLLRAGLTPGLRSGLLPVAGSRRWPRVLLSRPGAQPATALRNALSGRHSAARLVLVVDQFEEIFTQCRDRAERLRFVGDVLALARRGALVVLGVRADYYADCASVDELRPLLPDDQLVVGPMSESELRMAITRPAAAVGCAVEPGLTEVLLADLRPAGGGAHEPGALPWLGYALQATWYRRSGRLLTLSGYREAGGIHGAIADAADRIYDDFPGATRQVVRRIMLRLVSVGADAVSRQQVPATDLLAGLDGAESVLARFTQARLVSAGADGVEIAHEAFLDAWPRLREWIAEDRAGLRLHRQIAVDARSWAQAGHDPGSLYRGTRLGNARDWRADGGNELELTPLERDFLDASSAAQQAEQAAARRQRQAERRQNRRLRLLTAGLAVVLAAAVVAAGLAVSSAHSTNVQRQQAQANVFALQSDQDLASNPASADLLALAGWQEGHDETSLSSLLSREADPYQGSFPLPSDYLVTTLAVSPDGKLLAIGGLSAPGGELNVANARHGSSVQIWNLLTRQRLAVFSGLDGLPEDLAFSPGDGTLATAVSGGSLRLWNVATHRAEPTPPGPTENVSTLAYSPDGILATVQYSSPVINLWTATGRLIARLTAATAPVSSLAFSPDGKTLASGSSDGTARLWNMATDSERSVLRIHGPVNQVEFSPDGGLVALATEDGTVWEWNLATGSAINPTVLNFGTGDSPSLAFSHEGQYLYVLDPVRSQLADYDLVHHTETLDTLGPAQNPAEAPLFMAGSPAGPTLVLGGSGGFLVAYDEGQRTFADAGNGSLLSVALNPDGRLVASTAADGTVQLWNPARPADGTRILSTGESTASMLPVAFSPDGKLLATGGPGASVIVWNARTGSRLVTLTPPSVAGASTTGVAFSPNSRTLASYGDDGVAAVWDVATGRRLAVLRVPISTTALTTGLALSPDGPTLALANYTGTVLLWDYRTGRVTGRLDTGLAGSGAVAFSPNGRVLAAAAADSTVDLWTIGTGQVAVLTPLPTTVRSLAFSRDGTMLVTVGHDTSVRLWNVATRQLVAVLSGDTEQVNDAVFGPDDQTLITASGDATARVWDLNPAGEVRALCAALQGPGFAAQWQALTPVPGPDPCPGPR